MEWIFQEWLIILVLILANGFFAGAELAGDLLLTPLDAQRRRAT